MESFGISKLKFKGFLIRGALGATSELISTGGSF
jgi:hypothetical protein